MQLLDQPKLLERWNRLRGSAITVEQAHAARLMPVTSDLIPTEDDIRFGIAVSRDLGPDTRLVQGPFNSIGIWRANGFRHTAATL